MFVFVKNHGGFSLATRVSLECSLELIGVVMKTFVEETEGLQSSEKIPETQVCGVGGQISVEGGQKGGLDFDDHMTQ